MNKLSFLSTNFICTSRNSSSNVLVKNCNVQGPLWGSMGPRNGKYWFQPVLQNNCNKLKQALLNTSIIKGAQYYITCEEKVKCKFKWWKFLNEEVSHFPWHAFHLILAIVIHWSGSSLVHPAAVCLSTHTRPPAHTGLGQCWLELHTTWHIN